LTISLPLSTTPEPIETRDVSSPPMNPLMESGRRRRLAEELEELGMLLESDEKWRSIFLDEVEYALRPRVHERRVPSYGAVIEPRVAPANWSKPTQLAITKFEVGAMSLPESRRFADGLSSWLVRRRGGGRDLVAFDRPAGSERDIGVIAAASGATVVQRHPSGPVRIVGEFGVFRWDGLDWHHEPPLQGLIDAVEATAPIGHELLDQILSFAVHDLGARGIGATLVFGEARDLPSGVELRLEPPPALRIGRPMDLALIRHALGQVDGAAVFDLSGTLRELGVRLVPSPEAEQDVDGFRGMRHTSARRFSFDAPHATVVVVSEDGPVTVLRGGNMIGRSSPT